MCYRRGDAHAGVPAEAALLRSKGQPCRGGLTVPSRGWPCTRAEPAVAVLRTRGPDRHPCTDSLLSGSRQRAEDLRGEWRAGSQGAAGTRWATLQWRVGVPAEAAHTRRRLQRRRMRGPGEVSTTLQRRVCATAEAMHTRECLQRRRSRGREGSPAEAGSRFRAEAGRAHVLNPQRRCFARVALTATLARALWTRQRAVHRRGPTRQRAMENRSKDLARCESPLLSPPLPLPSLSLHLPSFALPSSPFSPSTFLLRPFSSRHRLAHSTVVICDGPAYEGRERGEK